MLYITFYYSPSTVTTSTDTTASSNIVTSDSHHLHSNSASTEVAFNITESISHPSSDDGGIGSESQGM